MKWLKITYSFKTAVQVWNEQKVKELFMCLIYIIMKYYRKNNYKKMFAAAHLSRFVWNVPIKGELGELHSISWYDSAWPSWRTFSAGRSVSRTFPCGWTFSWPSSFSFSLPTTRSQKVLRNINAMRLLFKHNHSILQKTTCGHPSSGWAPVGHCDWGSEERGPRASPAGAEVSCAPGAGVNLPKTQTLHREKQIIRFSRSITLWMTVEGLMYL